MTMPEAVKALSDPVDSHANCSWIRRCADRIRHLRLCARYCCVGQTRHAFRNVARLDYPERCGKAAVVAEVRKLAGDRAMLPIPSTALIAVAHRRSHNLEYAAVRHSPAIRRPGQGRTRCSRYLCCAGSSGTTAAPGFDKDRRAVAPDWRPSRDLRVVAAGLREARMPPRSRADRGSCAWLGTETRPPLEPHQTRTIGAPHDRAPRPERPHHPLGRGWPVTS
jgi:hypothetical protein